MKKKFICFSILIVLFCLSTNIKVYSSNEPGSNEKVEDLNQKNNQIIIQYWDDEHEGDLSESSLSKNSPTKSSIASITSIEIMSVKKINSKIEVLSLANGENSDRLIKEIRQNKNVKFAEVNKMIYLNSIPNDTYYNLQSGLRDISMDKAWDELNGTANKVTVAVLDSGIDTQHPDLKNRINNTDSVNLVLENNNKNFMDDNGHGTSVSGIIAAQANNQIGIAGVAGTLDISILAVKIANSGGTIYLSDLLEAIEYSIVKNVDIINLSLGSYTYSDMENDAIQKAISKGITVIAAAGNNGNSEYAYPASYANVISVGAISNTGSFATYSNHNDRVDLVAPGSNIFTCKNGNQYIEQSGTSFAVPFVSGVTAVLKSINKSLTPQHIRKILTETALDKGITGKDDYYGYGLLNAHSAVLKTLSNYKGNLNGDVDNDGEVTDTDLIMMRKYFLGVEQSNFNRATADVNGDGNLTQDDLTMMRKYCVGLITQFPNR